MSFLKKVKGLDEDKWVKQTSIGLHGGKKWIDGKGGKTMRKTGENRTQRGEEKDRRKFS